MAMIDLRNFAYCTMQVTPNSDGTETETLGTGKMSNQIINTDVKSGSSQQKLYAGGRVAKTENNAIQGSGTVEFNFLPRENEAELLGHATETKTVNTKSVTVITRKEDDKAPWVRWGIIKTATENNVHKYVVEEYARTQFQEPDKAGKTKGEKVDFGTLKLPCTYISSAEDGSWERDVWCEDLATAQAELKDYCKVAEA